MAKKMHTIRGCRFFGKLLAVVAVLAAALVATESAMAAVTQVYWTDRDNGTLSVTDVTTGMTTVLASNFSRLQDVDLDTSTDILYFSDWGPLGTAGVGTINQVPKTGGAVTTVCGAGTLGAAVHQLALDQGNSQIYFTRAVSYDAHEISRVNYGPGCTGYTNYLFGDFGGPGWFPSGLAIDPATSPLSLYWGDIGVLFFPPNGSVNRMDLPGGANQIGLTPHVDGRGRGFALDPTFGASGTIFLTAHNPLSPETGGAVFSYDIMNNVETQIVPNDPASGYWDIEIDPDPTIGPRIWYTVYALGEIRSAKFDGSDVQVELSGLSNPYGLALELELDEPPLASAGNDQTDECTGPDGAQVTLDGSGSTDPDSTAGTNDDIVLFEWIEDFGLPSEVLLGTGETLVTTLALGSHAITLRVTDSAGDQDTDTLTASVVDTTPPTLSISLTPMVLWPPNHHMATIGAVVTADDACGGPVVSLTSVTSDEPDNASGAGDGNTTNDIQGVDIGTPDAEFELRAERAGTGDGRTYTAVYSASDGSGNVGSDSGLIFVPHDQGGATEPVSITVANKPDGLALEWNDVAGAFYYNVIRGGLANLHEAQNAIDLGVVTCVQEQAVEAGASGLDSDVSPEPGQVFFYLVEYFDGWNHCGYGTESVPKPRMPNAGDCE